MPRAEGPPPLHFPDAGRPDDPRAWRQRRYLPDVPVVDDSGRALRFYRDVVRGRRVVLHSIYTACGRSCPPATHNLLQARGLLGADAASLRCVSITLTPQADDPAALAAFRQRFGLPPDWLLLTGPPRHVDALCRALGFLSDDAGIALDEHAGAGWVGDEPAVKWGHVPMLQSPRAIARMIRFGLA